MIEAPRAGTIPINGEHETAKFLDGLDDSLARLEGRFASLTPDPQARRSAVVLLREWLTNPLHEPQRDVVVAHLTHDKIPLLFDSFYQSLPFGTGGRRGRVGYGPNRINASTVILSVQGHCNYLRAAGRTGSVVLAYDVRVFNDLFGTYSFLGSGHPVLGLSSRDLAKLACEVYAANGIVVHTPAPAQFLSTPELSFLIRRLSADGGMNVSASHNHPDDNGFKFYTADGAQDIPPEDERLAGQMEGVRSVERIPFREAQERDLVRPIPSELHQEYLEANLSVQTARRASRSQIPIVFSPLCGTGDSTVGDVLRAAGYRVELYAPQAEPDGSFASVPSRMPNPELPASARPALPLADSAGSSLILFTDPDADRLGVYARSRRGDWSYLSGNEIATAIAYYLIGDERRGPRRRGLVVKTLVTSRAIEEIARSAGCVLVPDLLVGFKYIADVLNKLETAGRFRDIVAEPRDLVLAAEESHGLLLSPRIRDKDAAGGALVLAELTSRLLEEQQGLPEYLDEVAARTGNFANSAASLVMRGFEGAQMLSRLMDSLRRDRVETVGGRPVLGFDDFLLPQNGRGDIRSQTDRSARNLLVLHLEGAQVVIRPSGTEPKAKIYVDVEGRRLWIPEDRGAATLLARRIAEDVVDLSLARLGVSLSPSAKRLPDFVDLDLRKAFDDTFRAELLANAEEMAGKAPEEVGAWLRRALQRYGGGGDPLETAGEAARHLADSLADETSSPAFRRGCRAVARAALPASMADTGAGGKSGREGAAWGAS